MTETKFTPGPWFATVDESGENLDVRDGPLDEGGFPTGEIVVGGCGCCGSPWTNENRAHANAALIAAAPDLYEAGMTLASAADSKMATVAQIADAVRQMRAALAKARGE